MGVTELDFNGFETPPVDRDSVFLAISKAGAAGLVTVELTEINEGYGYLEQEVEPVIGERVFGSGEVLVSETSTVSLIYAQGSGDETPPKLFVGSRVTVHVTTPADGVVWDVQVNDVTVHVIDASKTGQTDLNLLGMLVEYFYYTDKELGGISIVPSGAGATGVGCAEGVIIRSGNPSFQSEGSTTPEA